MLRSLSLAAAVGLLLAGAAAAAADLRLVTAELPPYCYRDPPPLLTAVSETAGQPEGLVCSTVEAMARRIGNPPVIEFMGWTVAQDLAQRQPNIGILALTRSPEREDRYRWLVKIVSDDLVVVGAAGIDVASLAALKDRPVGVLQSSGAEQWLREQGFVRIVPRAEEWLNALDLKERLIDAWVAPRLMILYAVRLVGGDVATLRFGEIIRRSDIYLAASKDVSDADAARWQAAFRAMQQDGSFDAIVARYRRPPVAPVAEPVLRQRAIEWGQ
jgi:polar amino acid transport system substrate-binding protein